MSRHSNKYDWEQWLKYDWNVQQGHFGPYKLEKRKKLSPEEEALREARKVANIKIGFMAHLIPYLTVCTFLLFVAGFRVAFIVGLAWGIGLTIHGFFAMIVPDLRKNWIAQEVSRKVSEGVVRERRTMENKHTRSVEELSASIAHEIRNPITAAKSLVQQMGEDPHAKDNVEYAKVALDELDRVERSISNLLRFARDEDIRMEPVIISNVLSSAMETFRDRIERINVEVRRNINEVGPVLGDPEKLRRVIINLLNNALDAFEEHRTKNPCIEIDIGENLAGTGVWVRVRDNGPGIDPEALHKIFNPFYTNKEKGTGLGLALSKKVMDAHGGSIEAESKPGQGTEFVLTLPKPSDEPGEPQ